LTGLLLDAFVARTAGFRGFFAADLAFFRVFFVVVMDSSYSLNKASSLLGAEQIRVHATLFTVKTSRQSPGWIVVSMLLLVCSVSCRSKDPLSLLLDDLEKAVEARDIDALEKRLATSFKGNDRIGREEAVATLRRYFIAYERIKIDITSVKRAKSGNRLNFQVSFSGKTNTAFNLQNLLPSTATYDFELRLIEEGSTLKVDKAYWWEVAATL
jgi:hypothetical protein